MRYTDLPHRVSPDDYERAISHMVDRMRQQRDIVSVMQIGSVTTPGISDIDIMVVSEDGAACRINPLEQSSAPDRYLFVHGLYGTSRTLFREIRKYTFFHHYRTLWGEDLALEEEPSLMPGEIRKLKTQTALEYLIKMFITLTVQATFGMIKLRSLFLEVPAVRHDLDFLDISHGPLRDLVSAFSVLRQEWFQNGDAAGALPHLISAFHSELRHVIEDALSTGTWYVPRWSDLRVARNITLCRSERIGVEHQGRLLPQSLGMLGKKYFSLQNRFSSFRFHFPLESCTDDSVIARRFEALKRARDYNRDHLPWFSSPGPGLAIV